jgi:AraC-like DNA-binding protein
MNIKRTLLKADNRTVPAASVRCLLDLGVQWGVSADQLLENCGVSKVLIETPDGRIKTLLAGKLVEKLMQLSGRSDIGLQYGLSMPLTILGYLGYAAMSCDNLLQAFQLIHKYQAIHLNELDITLKIINDEAVITIEENYKLGLIRQAFLESLIVGACHHFSFWIGKQLSDLNIYVDWSEPDYFKNFKDSLVPWKFQQNSIQIRFRVSDLNQHLIMADPAAVNRALAQLEKEIAGLPGLTTTNLVPMVKSCLRSKVNNRYPCLKEIAEQLNFSERTLKRKLHDTGYTFQMLLDQTREQEAVQLINENRLTIQEIALVLGYMDPTAFTKAFKRWTGLTPTDFRHQSSKKTVV